MTAVDGSILVNQALDALKARDRDAAAARLSALIALDPPMGATWGSVSRLATAVGEINTAILAAGRHAAAQPADAAPRLNLGRILAHNGRVKEARDVGLTLVRDQPDNPAAWHFLGTCRAQLGEREAAMGDLRRAIAQPRAGSSAAFSWLTLSGLKTFAAGDPDIAAMQALLWTIGQGEVEARSALNYAIGKAWDDIGDTERAFAAYSDGAASRAKAPGEPDTLVDDIVTGFTPKVLEALRKASPSSPGGGARPIFVFGMPRSGTTLVEQILVSHDQVADGAELNLLLTAFMPIGGITADVVQTYAAARPDGLQSIGTAYLRMLDQRFGPATKAVDRVVDKTMNLSRYLGLVHAILPEARFIWLRREPAAVAWSCFRTHFATGLDWTWSLPAIGRHLRNEDRLHAHWTSVMGDAILSVPYEELVGGPDAWIPRILDHVGLPHQEGLKDFHATDRAVATASSAQVRKPMYTTSTDAWRPYEAHLKPFFDAYQGR